MGKLENSSIQELEQKLKVTNTLRITVGVIFGIIVLAWIVLGYWHSNLPVFISTVVMGLTSLLVTSISPRHIAAEIRRRRDRQ
jgi:hypothetical protein